MSDPSTLPYGPARTKLYWKAKPALPVEAAEHDAWAQSQGFVDAADYEQEAQEAFDETHREEANSE